MLDADLVIGAVLVPGAKAPKLVTNELVSRMKPGSVLVDISIDQGGCFEDSRPTTHADPTYQVHDSVFYCVANMPGAVPHTSTYALTNVTLPYAVELANRGWRDALRARPARWRSGLNTHDGAGHLRPGRRGARHAAHAAGRGPRLSAAADAAGRRRRRCDGAAVRRLPRPPARSSAGWPANTLALLPARPRAATSSSCAGRGVTDPGDGHRARRRRVPRRAARGRRRTHPPLAASSAARAAGRGPRLAPVPAAARAWPAPTPPARSARPRRRSGCPRRSPSTTSSGCSRRPASATPPRRAARPGAAGVPVRHRGADLRGGRPRRRRPRPRATGAVVLLRGKGGKERMVPLGGYAGAAARRLPGPGPARRWPPPARGTPALFLNARGGAAVPAERLDRPARGRRAGRRSAARRLARTPCGTRSPPTCSTAAPTSGSCRSCSATPR